METMISRYRIMAHQARAATPDKEAVVDGEKRLTYRQLNQRVNRLSRALMDLGLKNGDRLGILAHNRLEFLEAIMAAAKLGLILVPLNWRLTPPELAFILKTARRKRCFSTRNLPILPKKFAARSL